MYKLGYVVSIGHIHIRETHSIQQPIPLFNILCKQDIQIEFCSSIIYRIALKGNKKILVNHCFNIFHIWQHSNSSPFMLLRNPLIAFLVQFKYCISYLIHHEWVGLETFNKSTMTIKE